MKINILKIMMLSALCCVALNVSATTGADLGGNAGDLTLGAAYTATFASDGEPKRARLSQSDIGVSCSTLLAFAKKANIVVKKISPHVLVIKDKTGKFDFSPVVRTDDTHLVTIVSYAGQDGIAVTVPLVLNLTGKQTADFALGACKGSVKLA